MQKSLRKNSAFQRLTAAYSFNEMGGTIAYILIPLVILELTGSATQAGLVSALAITASTIASIMSGALADRINPTFLLRLSFGLEFVWWWGFLAFLLWTHNANVVLIAILSIISATVGSIDGPSEFVILKRIVPTEQFGEATAVTEARGSATGLIGTPIGGALFSLGSYIAFGI
ncbi:MAG: MFS transporter [Corynebacterium sp.]|nr:MFS transporter [Corynebacterium sp.]